MLPLLLRVPLSLLVDDEVVVTLLQHVVLGAVVGVVPVDLWPDPVPGMARRGRLETEVACALAAANVLARLPPVNSEPAGMPRLTRISAMILARNFVCSQQEKGSSRSGVRTPLLTVEPLLTVSSMQTRQPSTYDMYVLGSSHSAATFPIRLASVDALAVMWYPRTDRNLSVVEDIELPEDSASQVWSGRRAV